MRTFASIRTTMKAMLRSVTNARVTHAQCAMDKHFQIHFRHSVVDFGNLASRKFTCQDSALKTHLLQPPHLFSCTVISLSRCVQLHSEWNFRIPVFNQFQDAHILHEKRIHTNCVQRLKHFFGGSEFIFIDNRVYSHINSRAELMRIFTELLYVVERIARSRPCAKA